MKERKKLTIALVQMRIGHNKAKNLEKAYRFCMKAVQNGAKFILFPETFNYRQREDKPIEQAESIPGPSLEPLMNIAQRYKVWVLAGSLHEKVVSGAKVYNSSAVIGNDGRVKAVYHKMHLFDASLKAKKIVESKIYLRGKKPVIISIADIKTGLTICYDLRFPELYRQYAENGVKMFCVPSAFTHFTGKAHWEVLLRARAIENQCFVLAPNQCGAGIAGVQTYGNSMVVCPWGTVLARASGGREQVVYATLDFSRLAVVRNNLPVLKHRVLEDCYAKNRFKITAGQNLPEKH